VPAQSKLALLKQTWTDFSDDNASRLAAALAYYTIFALAPLLVIAVVVLSFIMRNNGGARDRVVHYFTSTAQGIDPDTIRTMIDKASSHGSGILATIIAAAITLAGAFGFYINLQGALNTVWSVKPRPDLSWMRTIKKRLVSFLIVGVIALLLLASLGVTTWITAFAQSHTGGLFGKILAYCLDIIGSLAVYTALFAAIYKFVPDVKISWKDVWVGAALTGVLFLAGKYLLSIYLTRGTSTSVFGAAGSLAALLIWIYYSSQIFLFGAEFTQVYARSIGAEIVPDEDAVPLDPHDRVVMGHVQSKPGLPQGKLPEAPEIRYAPSIPARRPAPRTSRTGQLVAAGGLALGFAMGAAGWLKNRNDPIRQARLDFAKYRLDKVEQRLGTVQRAERRAREIDVERRLADTHHRLNHALRELRKPIYREVNEKRTWTDALLNAVR
jgi:membrane protein